MNSFRMLSVLLLTAILSACDQQSIASRGFSLPDGDAESGQLVFVEMQCIQCHTLAGTDLSAQEWRLDQGMRYLTVELGGETTKVQTYADLVTSIINPSHRIAEGYPLDQVAEGGESKMANYNDILTIRELVDLVTFLKSQYKLQSVPLTIYPYYIYPG